MFFFRCFFGKELKWCKILQKQKLTEKFVYEVEINKNDEHGMSKLKEETLWAVEGHV